MLPIQGEANLSFAEQVLAHAPAVVPADVLVFGLLVLAVNPRLLLMGANGLPGSLPYRPNKQFASGSADGATRQLVPSRSAQDLRRRRPPRHTSSLDVAFLVAAVDAAAGLTSPSSPAPPEHSSKEARGRRTSCT